MKVQAPLSVSAVGGKHEIKDNTDTPDTLDIYYEYPGFTHVYTVRRGRTLFGFHGGHGMEFQRHQRHPVRRPRRLGRDADRATQPRRRSTAARSSTSRHVQNFLHCIRNRSEKTASDIEDMHRATTTCHLANISYKVKRRIYWDPVDERCYRGYDPATKKFLNEDAEANAYLLARAAEAVVAGDLKVKKLETRFLGETGFLCSVDEAARFVFVP